MYVWANFDYTDSVTTGKCCHERKERRYIFVSVTPLKELYIEIRALKSWIIYRCFILRQLRSKIVSNLFCFHKCFSVCDNIPFLSHVGAAGFIVCGSWENHATILNAHLSLEDFSDRKGLKFILKFVHHEQSRISALHFSVFITTWNTILLQKKNHYKIKELIGLVCT